MGWEATEEVVTPGASSEWKPELLAPNPVMERAQATFQTADDFVRAAANAPFGLGNRLAGAMPGSSTAEQVRLSEEARKRSPYASLAGDVAGTAAIPSMGGAALAQRLGGGAAARAAGFGLEGAGIGAAQGAGQTYSGDWRDYLRAAGMGAIFGGTTGAAGGAAFAPRPPVTGAMLPSTKEIRQASDLGYEALRANPTPYSGQHFKQVADALEQRLLTAGYVRDYSPGAFAAVDRMRQAAEHGGVVTPGNLETIRQGLGRIPKSEQSAVDRAAARVVRDTLDDFLVNPPAGAVPPGYAKEAAQASGLAEFARGAYAGAKRTGLIEDITSRASNVAERQHSGRNLDNVIRQQVDQYLLNPMSTSARGRLQGFSEPERKALQHVVEPGRAADALRTAGNMLGGGGGIGTPLVALATGAGVGGATGHLFKDDPSAGAIVGLGAAGAGLGLRGAANRAATNRLLAAQELIRQRNPLSEARMAVAPMVPGPSPLSAANTANVRDLITLEWLRQQQTGGQ